MIYFDETPCPAFLLEVDLDEESWALFCRRAKIPESMPTELALRNLRLIGKDGCMTQAGAWLLARDVRKFRTSGEVACTLFMGTEKMRILDRRDFHGDVYSQIDEVVAWILSKINIEYIIKRVRREERPELPEEAIREAVVNALAHRDYRSSANVQVYVFKDRVEVVSPGGLPAGMTETDLGVKSVPRNPLLFGVLQRMEGGGEDRFGHSADPGAVPRPRGGGAPDRGLRRLGDHDFPPPGPRRPAQQAEVPPDGPGPGTAGGAGPGAGLTPTPYSEDTLVQQTTADYLERSLGWESVYAHNREDFGPESLLGRASDREVVLRRPLRVKLAELNPGLPEAAYDDAARQVIDVSAAQTLVSANREKYGLMRDGVRVTFTNERGGRESRRLRLFDFDEPANNHFLCARELWVRGDLYRRRADIVGFVNGLPLLFVECKNIHRDLKAAFEQNYSDYRDTIPHLFHHNAIVMFANGEKARIGSVTSRWEHFHEWKRLAEEEPGVVDMETLLKGVCDKRNFLDLVENFILFDDSAGETRKILARNHQFLGVNRAVEAVRDRRAREGRLGVFWHTQGAGKSYSMVMFTRKVHRRLGGQFTFLILTDRDDSRRPDLQDLRRLRGGGPRPRSLPRCQRRAPPPIAGRAQVPRLLADPEVPRGRRGRLHPAPRHRRHHRRGAPHAVRLPGAQHAAAPCPRPATSASRARPCSRRTRSRGASSRVRLDLRLPAGRGG